MVLELDFFHKNNMPGEGTKYIIRRHVDKLMSNILKDLQDFSLKVNLKERSLCQLYNLIICAEDRIRPHSNDILKQVIYKNILDEEPDIS